jgi:RNA polymerase sigma-70 factor (ECF subfamily)
VIDAARRIMAAESGLPLRLVFGVFAEEPRRRRAEDDGEARGEERREERSHEALVAGFLRGDPESREALARHVLSLALRTALAMLPNRELAQDAAQEASLEALRDLSQLRDPRRLDAWVHAICIRRIVRARRAHARIAAQEGVLDETAAADGVSHEALAAREVRRSLATLPARQRAAVILRYVHDLRESEIADVLGCRPGTAGALLSRARATLRADARLRELARDLGLDLGHE